MYTQGVIFGGFVTAEFAAWIIIKYTYKNWFDGGSFHSYILDPSNYWHCVVHVQILSIS